jgi:hypothetical protein
VTARSTDARIVSLVDGGIKRAVPLMVDVRQTGGSMVAPLDGLSYVTWRSPIA